MPTENMPETRSAVLIVDDFQPMRAFLAMIVRMADSLRAILEACDGSEAVAILRGETGRSILIVITDQKMPGPQGHEVAAQAKGAGVPHVYIATSSPRDVPTSMLPEGVAVVDKMADKVLPGSSFYRQISEILGNR